MVTSLLRDIIEIMDPNTAHGLIANIAISWIVASEDGCVQHSTSHNLYSSYGIMCYDLGAIHWGPCT